MEHFDAKQIQMGTATHVALQKCEAVDMSFRHAITPLAICKRREQRHNRALTGSSARSEDSIRAAVGNMYEAANEQAQARSMFEEATRIILELADGIKDKALRSLFLAGPQIAPVLQHARYNPSSMPTDLRTPSGL
jgi:hypothetical protein